MSDIVVTGTKTLSTALRVGVKYNYETTNESNEKVQESRYHIYGPVTVTSAGSDGSDYNDPSDNYIINGDSRKIVTLASKDATHFLVPDSEIIPADKGGNGITVEIYVWMEGEDHNLFSDNYNPEDLSVSVVFKNIGTETISQSA